MFKCSVVVVLWVVVGVACNSPREPEVVAREQALFDCNDPGQRLTCAPPSDPTTRFVCHATKHGYDKIEVDLGSHGHTPGVAHNPHKPADQAPGASGNDVGAGSPGLDCECDVRVCGDTCTGGPDGAECGPNQQCDTGVCTALAVVINEVESSGGVPGDWIELYNDGSTVAYVGGWIVSDSDDSHAYTIPAGTTLAPGAYLVIDEAQLGFGLGGGDAARLFAGDTLVDSYVWAAHAVTSYGRCPNGSGAFRTTTTTTKGTANDCSIVVTINEVESSGGVPGDWVELYNPTSVTFDLGGLVFKDSDDTHAYTLAAGTTIAPGGYVVLDEATFGFGLGGADSARLFDGATLVDSYAWTTHAATTYGRCPNGTGSFVTQPSSTKNAANDCGIGVTINEVESNGGVPGDWVELYNTNATPLDISGWIFRDSDDTHAYVIPAGTVLAPGAYYLLEEAAFGFGLGGADSARLFDGTTLVDSYAWTTHAASTYGRCPNGTGAFAATLSTKAAANDCGAPPGSQADPWPGANQVTTIDAANTYGTNLSGLFHDGTDLWAVRNGPATLFRVGGPSWTLRYPDGTGTPDAEDLTLVGGAVYVATERDNDNGAVSRPSILRFTLGIGAELIATHEWNVAAALPVIGANVGLEAITFIPDAFLTANGFVDQNTAAVYAPAMYADHGGGLFFVGLETDGRIYAFALNHTTSAFTLVASFASGDITSKALSFDASSGYLWQHCGVACAGDTRVLVPGGGSFVTKRVFARPSSMANLQNEGIALGVCTGSSRPFYWTDDAQTDGHALRVDSIPCGAFITP